MGAAAVSFLFVSCNGTSVPDPDPKDENSVLVGVTAQEDVSVDAIVNEVFSADEDIALPEDLEKQKQNKESLLLAAQDLNDRYGGGNGSYHKNVTYTVVTLNYKSVDGNGNPVTLSGKLTLPKVAGEYVMIEDILLHCHATNIDVTGKGVSNATFKDMAAYSFAILDPDYMGFGVTSGKPQTYLCQKLIGRQCVDMELAALEYMKQEGVQIKDGYGTYVMGYSQGGGNAMAVGRYLQVTDEGRQANAKVNLKGMFCGAGPYSPEGTFNHWLQSDSLSLSPVLSMVIKGQQEGHSDIMKNINLTSYFSEDYLVSGVPQAFDTGNLSNMLGLLNADKELESIQYPEPENPTTYDVLLLKLMPWMQFSKIMSPEFSNPNSHIRQALLECLKLECVNDWTPRVPVELYTAPRDNVIPVQANAIDTYEKFHGAGANVTLVKAGELANHITGQVAWVNHVKIMLKRL